jgi:hypothetical protein
LSNYLLVRLEPDLGKLATSRGVIFTLIRLIRGVISVDDIEIISRATLDEWLLPEDTNYQTAHTRRQRKPRPDDHS